VRYVWRSSLVATTALLMLNGCGEDKTACQFDIQEAMDKGHYSSAISLLEGECSDTYNAQDTNYNLAFAYLGESGYGVSDILSALVDAGDDEDNSSEGDDAFADFVTSISEKSEDDAIVTLTKAKEYFVKSIDENATIDELKVECDADNNDTSKRFDDVCVYLGFTQTVITAASVNYLTNNVEATMKAIESDSEEDTTPLDTQASLDALAWAVGEAELPNESTITASDVVINGYNYQHLEVQLEGKTFFRLAESSAPSETSSTVVTKGYCDSNGSKESCGGIEQEDGSIDMNNPLIASCYACPVSFGDDSLKMSEVLVDALNDGTDIIKSLVDDDDIDESIDDFMEEIAGEGKDEVTIQDIIEYFNDEQDNE